MEDLSLHVLDIAENAVGADATTIAIAVILDRECNRLLITITDDGRGMDAGELARVRDPFFTTKCKKTGLGIPLLAQAAEQAEGNLTIESTPGKGTRVAVSFSWGHIDRPAIGNMVETILALVAGHPGIEVVYAEEDGERVFRFDTREIRRELADVPLEAPAALGAIRTLLEDGCRLSDDEERN